MLSKAISIFLKDFRQEFRTRYAINSIMLFGITTLTVVSFSLGESNLPPKLSATLYWIIIFFSAMSSLAHVFVREEESGTAMALRLHTEAEPVFLGKFLFNFTILALLMLTITPLFLIFTDSYQGDMLLFSLILLLGIIDLCSATTIIAAIVARASVKGALFAILSFPIMLPLLLVLVKATEKVFMDSTFSQLNSEFLFLISFPIVMLTASFMLFRFVWFD